MSANSLKSHKQRDPGVQPNPVQGLESSLLLGHYLAIDLIINPRKRASRAMPIPALFASTPLLSNLYQPIQSARHYFQ
jgi:hypothetical protein